MCDKAEQSGGEAAGEARTGVPVVTSKNAIEFLQLLNLVEAATTDPKT